ncbi:hypothetical protein C4579_01790 [Candidatus Microgenomates bacterium]|nr:MAG: hypothetical protein C4579_01790 [Candidatus Microgenomates bacterium]
MAGQAVSTTLFGPRISLLDVGVGLFVAWGVSLVFSQKKVLLTYSSMFGPFLIVALFSLFLALITAPDIVTLASGLYLLRFIVYTLVFPVMMRFSKLEKMRNLKMLWFAGISLGIIGLGQYFLYPNLRNLIYQGWDPHQFRVFSTLFDPNFTAILLLLTLILGYFLFQKKMLSQLTFYGASILVGISFLLTYSRGGYFALIVCLLSFAWVKRQLKAMLLIGLLFFALVLLPRPHGEGVNLFRTISAEARITNIRAGFELWGQHPFFGVGFNTLASYTKNPGTVRSLSHAAQGFQNSYVFLLATTGIVGLLSFGWVGKKLFHSIVQNFRHKEQPAKILLLLSSLALGTHSLFDNSLFYPYCLFWIMVVLGSTVAAED